jgi:hypothetical protein
MSWNPFKKKSIDPNRNIVDELANTLQRNGKINTLETELTKIKLGDLNKKEIESWHHIYGICAFQAGNHREASERFRNGLMQCPDSSEIKFSLAQEFIFLGEPEKAFPLFDECIFPRVSREFALAMSRYAYLFAEHERGIRYLEKFFDIYKEVRILDDHFLYVRGLPFFSVSWSHLAAHSILSGNEAKLEQITSEIEKVCHDYDFETLRKELDALITGEFSNLLSFLIEKRQELTKYNVPTGYTDMRIAIFESFNSKSHAEALDVLDTVHLNKNDFRWLEDMRTLAKAEAAHRFDETEAEDKLVAAFLSNQTMLFEPDHAVSFGLLKYQEVLKPRVTIVKGS